MKKYNTKIIVILSFIIVSTLFGIVLIGKEKPMLGGRPPEPMPPLAMKENVPSLPVPPEFQKETNDYRIIYNSVLDKYIVEENKVRSSILHGGTWRQWESLIEFEGKDGKRIADEYLNTLLREKRNEAERERQQKEKQDKIDNSWIIIRTESP
uniref:Uncharacterized protein n=2 Tax=viral metagenome TaxID=1070528 RepID=A0A6H2A1X1_9ZZZZ